MLRLKLQYFGYLMQRADSLEKILMLGKIEGKRRRRQQRMRWLDSVTHSMDMNLSKLGDNEGLGSLVYCSPWGCRVRHDLVAEQQQHWWLRSEAAGSSAYLRKDQLIGTQAVLCVYQKFITEVYQRWIFREHYGLFWENSYLPILIRYHS